MTKRCKAIWIYSVLFWVLAGIGLVLFGFAFARVDINTVALREQYWTGAIDTVVYTSGVYHRGLTYQFIRFPAQMQYIVHQESSPYGPLHLLSKDSQPFKLEYTAAYRLKSTSLQLIYQNYSSNYLDMVRSAINVPIDQRQNRILRVVSGVQSSDLWKTTTQVAIKEQLIALFGAANEHYGVELHAFWLGALTFTNLEEYFATAYMNSSSTSSVFAQSQSDLMSTSFQISALNSTINSFVKQKAQEARNSQATSYVANTNLKDLISNMTANQSAMGTNARFFALRNYTRILFV